MTQENIPPIFCSACGQKNEGGANFCAKCGKQILSTVIAQPPSPGTFPSPTIPSPEGSAQKSSGVVTAMAVVGFVFGLIGMLGSFLPIIGIFTIKICIGAAVISGLSIVLALSLDAKRTFSIVALTVSLIGIGMWYVQISKINSATRTVKELTAEMQTNLSQQTQQTQQIPEQQIQQQNTQPIIVMDAFITSGLDVNQKPIDRKEIFPSGPQTLYYYATYTGAIPGKTKFGIAWHKKEFFIRSAEIIAKYADGNILFPLNYDFQPGKYEVRLDSSSPNLYFGPTNFEIIDQAHSPPPPPPVSFVNRCGVCHGLDRIVSRKETREKWEQIINEMMGKKADWIPAQEGREILDWLSLVYGN